jgi:hypothetical protein
LPATWLLLFLAFGVVMTLIEGSGLMMSTYQLKPITSLSEKSDAAALIIEYCKN